MAHEILHALGFNHEQKRPDRDDSVSVWIDFSEISEVNSIIQGMFNESNFGHTIYLI
jgi:hypothetical protein